MMSLSKVSVVKVASVKQRARPEDGQCAKVDVVDVEQQGMESRDERASTGDHVAVSSS